MNRRAQGAVAAAELVPAAALVVLAVRWWHHGMIATGAAEAELFRVDGRWWTAAVLVATVAGLLLIDAARRLALRGRRSRSSIGPRSPPPHGTRSSLSRGD